MSKEGHRRTNGDVVVVVDHDEVAKLQVTSCTGCLAGNALHGTSITEKAICVVVDKLKPGLVEDRSSVCLCDCKTNGVGETLTKWSSGDFDTRSVVCFWVAGADAVDLLCRPSAQYHGSEAGGWLTRKCFRSSMERA